MKSKFLISLVIALIIFLQIDFNGLSCSLVYKHKTSIDDAFKELRFYQLITFGLLTLMIYISISICKKIKKVAFIFLLCLTNLLSLNAQQENGVFVDSVKQILIGEWRYIDESLEMNLAEHLNYYEEIPDFAKRKLNEIAGIEIEKSLIIKFTSNDKFIISNKESKKEYRLSIFEKELWASRSDYIITIFYEIDTDKNLILTSKPLVGESKIKLKKE